MKSTYISLQFGSLQDGRGYIAISFLLRQRGLRNHFVFPIGGKGYIAISLLSKAARVTPPFHFPLRQQGLCSHFTSPAYLWEWGAYWWCAAERRGLQGRPFFARHSLLPLSLPPSCRFTSNMPGTLFPSTNFLIPGRTCPCKKRAYHTEPLHGSESDSCLLQLLEACTFIAFGTVPGVVRVLHDMGNNPVPKCQLLHKRHQHVRQGIWLNVWRLS